MKARKAKISDAKAIYSLINYYAEQDKMLFRSMSDIYENLQVFIVVEDNSEVVGCCALQIVWDSLAEIKSLAVNDGYQGRGVGKMLVEGALFEAGQLGISRVFTLTLVPEFFEKMGFSLVDRDNLPMKVWSDCARCPKQENCDETALLRDL